MSKELLGNLEINRIYQFDVLEGLKLLPDRSINMCVTSPPYWGLRNYDNSKQIGLEKTPNDYVDKLVLVFREIRRVLKDDGILWLNLGDIYAQPKGHSTGTRKGNEKGQKYGEELMTEKNYINKKTVWYDLDPKEIGLKPKDLVGLPWRVAFALQNDGWYLRSDVIWNKPNSMPEPVRDRPVKSHEYLFLLSKSKKYYFNYQDIKEPTASNKEMRSKRSVWNVNTKPFKEAHFATFPEELIEPCIISGCPENGIVIDPFMGAGTTALVTLKLGKNRKFIGFELNSEYIEIANKRIDSVL